MDLQDRDFDVFSRIHAVNAGVAKNILRARRSKSLKNSLNGHFSIFTPDLMGPAFCKFHKSLTFAVLIFRESIWQIISQQKKESAPTK